MPAQPHTALDLHAIHDLCAWQNGCPSLGLPGTQENDPGPLSVGQAELRGVASASSVPHSEGYLLCGLSLPKSIHLLNLAWTFKTKNGRKSLRINPYRAFDKAYINLHLVKSNCRKKYVQHKLKYCCACYAVSRGILEPWHFSWLNVPFDFFSFSALIL